MPITTTSADFVAWFRSVAPYINAFRGRTFVIAFGGEVVADGKFVELTHDFNLLASLGIRLVLVHGARPQIEQHLAKNNLEGTYHRGIRLTDAETMQCVKEAVGRVRVEIEALLSMGLANSPMANADIRVAGGNFITAQPIGVINGVDLQHTGTVRKVDVAALNDRMEFGEVVLLSPLRCHPSPFPLYPSPNILQLTGDHHAIRQHPHRRHLEPGAEGKDRRRDHRHAGTHRAQAEKLYLYCLRRTAR
jgi:amino-acid N-acetyltransferase